MSAQYKRVVAEQEISDGFPLQPGSSLQRSFTLTPLFNKCKEKRGLAVDGHLRDEDTLLASSTIFPTSNSQAELTEFKDKHGVLVRYMAKITLVVALGTDLKLNLPFLLTHPRPPPPPEPVEKPSESTSEVDQPESLPPSYEALDPKPKTPDENLIRFDDGPDDGDLVFEEFIRFRVSGDTDA